MFHIFQIKRMNVVQSKLPNTDTMRCAANYDFDGFRTFVNSFKQHLFLETCYLLRLFLRKCEIYICFLQLCLVHFVRVSSPFSFHSQNECQNFTMREFNNTYLFTLRARKRWEVETLHDRFFQIRCEYHLTGEGYWESVTKSVNL